MGKPEFLTAIPDKAAPPPNYKCILSGGRQPSPDQAGSLCHVEEASFSRIKPILYESNFSLLELIHSTTFSKQQLKASRPDSAVQK